MSKSISLINSLIINLIRDADLCDPKTCEAARVALKEDSEATEIKEALLFLNKVQELDYKDEIIAIDQH